MSKPLLKSITSMTPTRVFFRCSQPLPSLAHAREIFNTLGKYGDMVEYKVIRCAETRMTLRYGFVVFKHETDAKKAIKDQFIKVDSAIFEEPCEIKIEASK